jgi:RNA polymerase sigma-70 factor (ECF subfamily)
VYSYVRSAGHDAQAALDLTQGFFARLLEKGDLKQADRTRGKFRSFLLASVKHFVANEWDRARAQRRGGGTSHLALNIVDAEAKYGPSLADPETPETIYEKQWAHALLEHALAGRGGQRLDAHIAIQDIHNVVIVKNVPAAPGQAQTGSADDD